MYEITEAYFRRKLSYKLVDDKIGIYDLLACQSLNFTGLQDFTKIGNDHNVKRFSKVGSYIVSLLVYRNFGGKPAFVSLNFTRLENLSLAIIENDPVTKERVPRLIDTAKNANISFELKPSESQEFFFVHLSPSFDIRVEEKVTC